jgi:hypothetical protein
MPNVLIESFTPDPYGEWRSVGTAEADPGHLETFYRRDSEPSGPTARRHISSVSVDDDVVTVVRTNAIGIEVERSTIVFETSAQADLFGRRIQSMIRL